MADMKKSMKLSDVFLACTMASVVVLAIILVAFMLNAKADGPVVGRGVGIIGGMAAQENAKEGDAAYFDAGHGYMYEVEDGEVRSVMAYSRSSYPFAFACGANVMNGSSVNSPLAQGDFLFATYPFGLDESDQVYPTWNRSTGEYQEVRDVAALGLSAALATPVTPEDLTGDQLSVQKESCIEMTAGASIVIVLFFVGFLVTWFATRKSMK